MSERDLIDELLLKASKVGIRLSRNNSGIAFFENGSTVAYGCFRPGGSDLLGWTPHVITQADIGRRVAVFTAVELKTAKQKPTDEQQRFLRAVERAGGIAEWGRDVNGLVERLIKWPPD